MVLHASSKPLRLSLEKNIKCLEFHAFGLYLYTPTLCGCIATEWILTRKGPRHPSFSVQGGKSKIPCHRKDHSLFRDHGSFYSNGDVWIRMTSFRMIYNQSCNQTIIYAINTNQILSLNDLYIVLLHLSQAHG